jgi:hypothetical protein
MKITVLLFFLILFSADVSAQNMEGRWKGTFSGFDAFSGEYQIFLDFYKINDTTFQALTTTVSGYTDTCVTLAKGYFYQKSKLHLSEIKIIKDFRRRNSEDCLMEFELSYIEKKKKITLNGNWTTKNGICGSGLIFLSKPL